MDRLNQLLKLHATSPEDAFLLFAIAKEYEKQNDYVKAIDYYKSLLSKNKDYIAAYYHLGKVYEVMEDIQNSREIYSSGIKIAQDIKDHKTLAELRNALMNLEMD